MSRLRWRPAWFAVTSVLAIGVLFVAVLPTRTYVAQRKSLQETGRSVAELAAQNRQLAARAERLNTDAEIERLAREQYHLVRPGEEAFAILPPARARPPRRPPAPAARTVEGERGVWARVWDGITFWS